MLDVRDLLEHYDALYARLKRRGEEAVSLLPRIRELAERRRSLIAETEAKRHRQKELGEEMPRAAKEGGERVAALRAELKELAEEVKAGKEALGAVQAELDDLLLRVPNPPHESVPDGADEADNEVVRVWGEKPRFEFEPKPHWELGEALGILDFERGAKLSGARFTVLWDAGARLSRALIDFMLETHLARGYREIAPPLLVSRETMTGTGQLPKFEEDAFKTATEPELFLIPTAEVPVTNLHRDEILEAASLPRRYTAYTPCFRAEAGSHGRDVRGLIRQHQFDKVELVQLTRPEQSYAAHEEMVEDASRILELLGLHHRVVNLCAGDLGFSAAKTYDLEVWLPGQGAYREISSVSNCEAFQARRMRIRYREAPKEKPRLLHTLNGSGLAVGRTLIAILEQYQEADGSVRVPEVLRDRLGGLERLCPPGER
ncbi:MAG: serine--tRNA ligase [Deltaproteobacteria bacterium]|nr:MAG: serine--tRNA ligase [Deltaproteobacteria bacterium]